MQRIDWHSRELSPITIITLHSLIQRWRPIYPVQSNLPSVFDVVVQPRTVTRMSRFVIGLCLLFALRVIEARRCIMYLTGQHNVIPEVNMVQDITHVIMAFMHSSAFKVLGATEWPLFSTVEEVRSRFAPDTAVMIAIGGWGDTEGFSKAAATDTSRKLFAQNVKKMIGATGADGVDIDWEYPGGNGDNYKSIPNFEKAWEINAYPKLLAEIRNALGPEKLISAAVPGLKRDMIAFTEANLHRLNESLDFLNIMTYDLMNRRDNITRHHTGVQLSLEGLNSYLSNGIAPWKANLGFAFYVKWFKTDHNDVGTCWKQKGIGCKTMLLEDSVTGADLDRSGSFSWHDPVPPELIASYSKAITRGSYDSHGGGHFFWDEEERIFWTWDTPEAIHRKFSLLVDELELGGIFAWGLGEDAPDFKHLQALTVALRGGSQFVHHSATHIKHSIAPIQKEEL